MFESDRQLQSWYWQFNFDVGVHGPHAGVTLASGEAGWT